MYRCQTLFYVVDWHEKSDFLLLQLFLLRLFFWSMISWKRTKKWPEPKNLFKVKNKLFHQCCLGHGGVDNVVDTAASNREFKNLAVCLIFSKLYILICNWWWLFTPIISGMNWNNRIGYVFRLLINQFKIRSAQWSAIKKF